MVEPRVPGEDRTILELPCGQRVDAIRDIDMGMREYGCTCGARHAVVMDVHPPSRFVPEDVVAAIRETVEVADDHGEFGTVHLMGMVSEEIPEEVASADVAGEGAAGYAMVWMTDRDARALHELVVELLVEMMDHAVGHAEERPGDFDEQVQSFDVVEFVEQYRRIRDFEDEHDTPV